MIFTEYIKRDKEKSPIVFNKVSKPQVTIIQVLSESFDALTIVFDCETQTVIIKSIKIMNKITKQFIYLDILLLSSLFLIYS
jgi:hypothetical protein